MSGQDYDKDLFLLITGHSMPSQKNFIDNIEDFIFGPKNAREATLVVPYVYDMGKGMDTVLNEWAIGNMKEQDEPNYPVHAFIEPECGHRSISHIKEGEALESGDSAIERAMSFLVQKQKEGNEVAVVVLYDEKRDIPLVGELKNYRSIPVYNIDGMIDAFPGFKTTDEILHEEREREEFETKEAIRLAAEKEQEAASAPPKPPRKRAAKKVAAKPVEAPKAVEAKVEKKSELPKELEPVKELTPKPSVAEYKAAVASGALVPEDLPGPDEVPDLWKDVSKARAELGAVTHYSVSKESLGELAEGIQEMSLSFSKTMGALVKIIEGK